MTRTLASLMILFFLAMVGMVVWGLAGNAPGALMASLLCAMPLFVFTLGAVLGRASNEYTITHKARPVQPVGSHEINPRVQRLARVDKEALS